MDINIQSQIVVKTAAAWALDATVYSAQRILVTSDATYGATDQRKFKIADGVQTWSNLNYFPVSGYDDATSSIQTQLNTYKRFATIQFVANSFSPADSTSYWLTPAASGAVGTATAARFRIKIDIAVTSFTAYLSYNLNVVGSNEGTTLKVRNHTQSTEANFTTALDLSVQAAALNYTATLSCNAGDEVEVIMTTPNYATNPTGLIPVVFLIF